MIIKIIKIYAGWGALSSVLDRETLERVCDGWGSGVSVSETFVKGRLIQSILFRNFF
jgi:hypothetical protein